MPYKDPEVAKQKARERYLQKKEEILSKCKAYYETHKEQHRASVKKWSDKNREHLHEYYAQYAKDNPDKVQKRNKDYKDRLRDECFAAYGNKCFCCGITVKEFLGMDHVFGGGNRHRKEDKSIRGGGSLHLYLKRRGYPATFRLSCHNCNQARGYYGYCPHELARRKS